MYPDITEDVKVALLEGPRPSKGWKWISWTHMKRLRGLNYF